MFSFSGWIIDRIDIEWKVSWTTVFLRRDGRVQQQKCSQYDHPMGKMRENERKVLDLPLGTLDVQLHFTVYQGGCSRCQHIETITPPSLTPKSQATDRLKQHVGQLCRYMPCNDSSVHPYLTPHGHALG